MAETNGENGRNISDAAKREEAVLAFWNERGIFEKSLEKDAPNGEYVFYDGPPFATGLPHHGHILAGTIKDTIPRYRTMRGYRVRRRWGWDCHGLPLENIVEKELGLKTKKDIEELGVEKFNETARGMVLHYADDWKRIIPRLGRWADMENDYKTMDATYTESVWWVFSELNRKGLVFEGFKPMHLCPRCGTTLSNFEVNQGYKDIKDIAVTVKLELKDEPGTYLLVWTTTPWTLPGNMAAAVHEDFEYVKVEQQTENGKEKVILAKDRLPLISGEHTVLETMKGSALVGKSYAPPFDYYKEGEKTPGIKLLSGEFKNAWKIYHAPYVSKDDGTGAVHLAPVYGDEDTYLAQKENIPLVHHVDTRGEFMPHIIDLAGRMAKPKDDPEKGILHTDADVEILKKLKDRGVLFSKENIVHSYPLCWRCETPLLVYATSSWFVRVTDIKDELVAENNKIHWVPEHVGRARFGNWLEGARDWAVSRQRYWGAPLPVWRNKKEGNYKVLGSLKDLQQYVKRSGNHYFTLRHGESEHNVKHVMSSTVGDSYTLTAKGKEQVAAAIEQLKDKGIEYIYASPLKRTQDTAALVALGLGLPSDRVITDERLRENPGGIFEGKSIDEWYAYRNALTDAAKLTDAFEGGESWISIKKRMVSVLFDLEQKYQKKNILIISHGMPLRLMKWGAENLPEKEMVHKWQEEGDIPTGSLHTIDFVPFPHNRNFELDYHRPYIDEVELFEGDEKLERVPDVFDCWFESGSMPYGQQHYPFEHTDIFEPKEDRGYPADFIAESVDQTRGWFYSLIVLGTALFGQSPYKNVITNGLVLAEDGRKMSKSLKNYPDPMDVVDKYGADTLRFYLLSSPIIRGEDLNFSEKNLAELSRKNIGRLANVLSFYELYKGVNVAAAESAHSPNVLDRWMNARLSEVTREMTEGMENYELDKGTRPLSALIDDLSVWYVRRSRERMKFGDISDQRFAVATLRYALRTLALLSAPSMPFFAEHLFQAVREDGDPESVHLAAWPLVGDIDSGLIATMSLIRSFATIGLSLRSEKGINVRQPLQAFLVKHGNTSPNYWDECVELLKDELNVKEVRLEVVAEGAEPSYDFAWDITPELQAEGEMRELMRHIQDMRKDAGLTPEDRIVVTIETDEEGKQRVEMPSFKERLMRTVGAVGVSFGDVEGGELKLEKRTYKVSISKR